MPQHFLYFLPLPQGQGSLRPTFFSTWMGIGFCFSPCPGCFLTVPSLPAL